MAQTFSLDAQTRTLIGKQVKQLRQVNQVPAVIYGAGGESLTVSCARRPLEIVLQHAGSTHLINVVVDGKIHNTLIREVQRHAIHRDILHVDFLRVDLTKKLRTEVPIMLIGSPKLDNEVQLEQNIQSIEVECLPTAIPEHIEVNIANLNLLGMHITIADLAPIEGVEFLADPTEVIVRISALATAVVEEVEVAEGTPVEPEVVEKGKKEEEEE